MPENVLPLYTEAGFPIIFPTLYDAVCCPFGDGDVAMDYLIAAHSDAGILKKINQDALLVKVALSALGRLCLCVVCDGMGGLSKGELASGTLIRAFERWFERDFPKCLKEILMCSC